MNHPQSGDWRRYPFQLVPGDPQLDFPAAEANHPDCESDTWFLAGELKGQSGRGYAFLSIFNKNRPGLADIRADFYTFALFDLDAGAYGTYTDYDMPPANMQPGTVAKMSVADVIATANKSLGAQIAVARFARLKVGEAAAT